jgi:hypothetical protein
MRSAGYTGRGSYHIISLGPLAILSGLKNGPESGRSNETGRVSVRTLTFDFTKKLRMVFENLAMNFRMRARDDVQKNDKFEDCIDTYPAHYVPNL